MLLYCLLHLTGYDLTLDDLQAFRQWESRTPGPSGDAAHRRASRPRPVRSGRAPRTRSAWRWPSARSRIASTARATRSSITARTRWSPTATSWRASPREAASLAGHLKLGKLIYLYDCNHISLDGPTSLAFSTEDVGARYAAYGWQVLHVANGDTDLAAIEPAITRGRRPTPTRPSIIVVQTTIGYGSPKKQGTAEAHGAPARRRRGRRRRSRRSASIPRAVVLRARPRRGALPLGGGARGAQADATWTRAFDALRRRRTRSSPRNGAASGGRAAGRLGPAISRRSDREATRRRRAGLGQGAERDRRARARALRRRRRPVGLDEHGAEGSRARSTARPAPVATSTSASASTRWARSRTASPTTAACARSCATFFCFSDYMRPAVRLAALNELPVIFVWTHDSIALGEDGPTHQPVEHLMSLRAMPNLAVVRPADANETAEAWRFAIDADGHRPAAPGADAPEAARARSRAGSPPAPGSRAAPTCSPTPQRRARRHPDRDRLRGATSRSPRASCSRREGIAARVVSMPCWEAFAEQDAAYRDVGAATARCARASRSRPASRSAGSAGSAMAASRSASIASARRRRARSTSSKLGFTAEHVSRAARQLVRRRS